MTKIASFTVDHTVLDEGIYVSRVDGDITTYDLRTRKPNTDDLMDASTMHSMEHMLATYMRNSAIGGDIIYFGPMGCQTGFYLLTRNQTNQEVLKQLKLALKRVIEHEGDIFGNSAVECGNYRTLSLENAKRESERYLKILEALKDPDFKYKA
ncbi:MAG: S-ribosylhomocysteine lyase [Ruminococcaceae bacterium]|nr:S-ribosylhomocysteine lyase [Oscillospiraceae bacterium]